jgi:hypothetical protein
VGGTQKLKKKILAENSKQRMLGVDCVKLKNTKMSKSQNDKCHYSSSSSSSSVAIWL